MDCTEVSWLSEMGLDNPYLIDNQCDHGRLMMEYSLDTCPSASSTLIRTHSPNSNSMGLDNPFLMDNQCDHGRLMMMEYSLDDEEIAAAVLGQDLDTTNSMITCDYEPPPHKLQKPNNFSDTINNIQATNSSAPIILNFSENQEKNPTPPSTLNPEEEAAVSEFLRSDKKAPARPTSRAYYHIVSERKRRKQLNQGFVALSTIVPGLKKMDKVSVLGEAIKYLKHLQERAKTLEKQSTKHTMESVVLVEKSHHVMAEEDEEEEDEDELPLPEIEARVCRSQLLLRVHCKREKGVLVNLFASLENLNLSVVNTNVNPYGSLALDVSVVAEMEKEFNLTVKEVVERLCAALTLSYLKSRIV